MQVVQPKLLLLIPPCFLDREIDFEVGFPAHLALLGREAKAHGWACDYLDMSLEEKDGFDSFADLEVRLRYPSLRLIGITNHTIRTSITTRAVAERVKAIRPDVAVVIGGVNATFMYRELLESCPAIDYILRGYAQQGLRALLASFGPARPLHVPGLVDRCRAEPEPLARPVHSDFATPALDGLEVERYLNWTSTYPLLTHTGCTFNCAFCTSVMPGPYQNREVYRPIADVLHEMRRAIDLGFRRVFMSANIFTSRREYCFELCEALTEMNFGARAAWSCMTRVEFVDDKLLRAMRASGCNDIAFGVESAGISQWNSLRKGRYSEATIERAFQFAHEAGIATTAFLMLGAPEQTPNDIDETLKLIRMIDPTHRVISFFQPFPGTPYWENPERFCISEIEPMEAWNFYEAPICRTKYFDKHQLQRAATRLHLERGIPISPAADTLELNDGFGGAFTNAPPPVLAAVQLLDGRASIEDVLEQVGQAHGPRGRLIAIVGLAARLRDGSLRVCTRRMMDAPYARFELGVNVETERATS
jgi:hypothetical protein